jgi:hypothetical protein
MGRFQAVAALALGFVQAPAPASSQDFCQRALADRPFPTLRNATNPEEGSSYYAVTWNLAYTRSAHLDSISRGLITATGMWSLEEWFFDSTKMRTKSLGRAPTDSAGRWSAAFQLAHLFNAGSVGATDGMGFAAASLYRYWRLPPEPAAAMLADPPTPTLARVKAVRALEPYWSTTTFRNAAAAALCILAAKADGIASIRHTDSLQEFDAFDMDEHELLSQIEWALGTVEESGGPSASPVIALLPPSNPLTGWLRDRFH